MYIIESVDWKTPVTPPKQANPVEIKRLLFDRVPKRKNDLKKWLEKKAAAKSAKQKANIQKTVEIKKGRLDKSLARLAALCDYASNNTLMNPKISEQKKQIVRSLIGRSARVISDAEGFAKETGIPAVDWYPETGYGSRWNGIIEKDPAAFAIEPEPPKNATPYEFEGSGEIAKSKKGEEPEPIVTTEPGEAPPPPPAVGAEVPELEPAAEKPEPAAEKPEPAAEKPEPEPKPEPEKAVAPEPEPEPEPEPVSITSVEDPEFAKAVGSIKALIDATWAVDSDKAAQAILKFVTSPTSYYGAVPLPTAEVNNAALLLAKPLKAEAIRRAMFSLVSSEPSATASHFGAFRKLENLLSWYDFSKSLDANQLINAMRFYAYSQTGTMPTALSATQYFADTTLSAMMTAVVPTGPDYEKSKKAVEAKFFELGWWAVEQGLTLPKAAESDFSAFRKAIHKDTGMWVTAGVVGSLLEEVVDEKLVTSIGDMSPAQKDLAMKTLEKALKGDKAKDGDFVLAIDALSAVAPFVANGEAVMALVSEHYASKGQFSETVAKSMLASMVGKIDVSDFFATPSKIPLIGSAKKIVTAAQPEELSVSDGESVANKLFKNPLIAWQQSEYADFIVKRLIEKNAQAMEDQVAKLFEKMTVGDPTNPGIWAAFAMLKPQFGSYQHVVDTALLYEAFATGDFSESVAKNFLSAVFKKAMFSDFIITPYPKNPDETDAKILTDSVTKNDMIPLDSVDSGYPILKQAIAAANAKADELFEAWYEELTEKFKGEDPGNAFIGQILPLVGEKFLSVALLADGDKSVSLETSAKNIDQALSKQTPPAEVAQPSPEPAGFVSLSELPPPGNPAFGYKKTEIGQLHKDFLKGTVGQMLADYNFTEATVPKTGSNWLVNVLRKKFSAEFGYKVALNVCRAYLKAGAAAAVDKAAATAAAAKNEFQAIFGFDEAFMDKLADVTLLPAEWGGVAPPLSSFSPGTKSEGAHYGEFAQIGVVTYMRKLENATFANAKEYISYGETAANRIQQILGLDYSPTAVVNYEGKAWSVQSWVEDGLSNVQGSLYSSATRVESFQKALVLNWLVGSADGNKGNYRVLPNGVVKSIDHGQAPRFMSGATWSKAAGGGNATLSLDWKYPSGNWKSGADLSLHTQLHREWADGADFALAPLSALEDMIKRAESIPEDVYKKLWRPYCERAKLTGSMGRYADDPKVSKSVDAFLDLMNERRMNLRRDVGRFYWELVARRSANTGENVTDLAKEVGLLDYGFSAGALVGGIDDSQWSAALDAVKTALSDGATKADVAKAMEMVDAFDPKAKTGLPGWKKIALGGVKTALSATLEARGAELEFGGIVEVAKVPTVAQIKKAGNVPLQFMAGGGAGGHIEGGVISAFASTDDDGKVDRVFASLKLTSAGDQSLMARLKNYGIQVESASLVPKPAVGPIEAMANTVRNEILFSGALEKLEAYAKNTAGCFSDLSPIRRTFKKCKRILGKEGYEPFDFSNFTGDAKTALIAAANHYHEALEKIILVDPEEKSQKGKPKWKLNPDIPVDDRVVGKWNALGEEAEAKKAKDAYEKALAEAEAKAKLAIPASIKVTELDDLSEFNVKGRWMKGGIDASDTSLKAVGGQPFKKGAKVSGGKAYKIDLGGDITAVYMPRKTKIQVGGSTVSAFAFWGDLRFSFPKGTTDSTIKSTLDRLSALGVKANPASAADAEVEYLRKTAWSIRRTELPALGAGGKEKNIALVEPTGLNSAQLADWYKTELSKKATPSQIAIGKKAAATDKVAAGFGQDITKLPGYDPKPVRIGGQVMWRKPEVSDEMLEKLATEYVLYQVPYTSSPGSIVRTQSNRALLSTTTRISLGIKEATGSPAADVETGGAQAVFMYFKKIPTNGLPKAHSHGANYFDARRIAYTGSWGAYGDTYGSTRYTSAAKDPKRRARTVDEGRLDEMMAKSEYITEVMATSAVPTSAWGIGAIPYKASQKSEIIKNLAAVDITQINGKPLDDYILGQSARFPRQKFKELKFDV